MEEPTQQPQSPQEQSPQSAPQGARVTVDDSKALAYYSNFCRVTGTPEEVLLDFGVNAQAFGNAPRPIEITQRIAMSYYSAKRMLAALHVTVQKHEQAFGALETDVQKRVQSS